MNNQKQTLKEASQALEEAIPYSIEALDFVAAYHDCIDNIRIVELRNL